ncbi:FUSC family protein, partial [Pseudomonas donghuensis]|nr:FUSC family protein [Pseudomonas donghuensis]
SAHTLKETQRVTQQALLTIAHGLYEGNPQPIRADSERLNEIVAELKQLMNERQGDNVAETPIHGYVWLIMELARQLELLSQLICRALRK